MVRRTDFSRESAFLGQDFKKLLEETGGKAAGLKLLEKCIEKFGDYKGRLGIPKYSVVPTSFWDEAETVLKRELEDPIAWCKKHEVLYDAQGEDEVKEALVAITFSKKKLQIPGLAQVVRKIRANLGRDFVDDLRAREDPESTGEYHLRSSSTVEDFVDDRYFGTFLSFGEIPFFSLKDKEGRKSLVGSLLLDFYRKKQDSSIELSKEDKLALILMPSIKGWWFKHAIVYSSYPEESESVCRIEVSSPRGYLFPALRSAGPEQLFSVRDGKIKVEHSLGFNYSVDENVKNLRDLEEKIVQELKEGKVSDKILTDLKDLRFMQSDRSKNNFVINEQMCQIPIEAVAILTQFAKECERELGPVNLEVLIDPIDAIYSFVQLRPVPRLDPQRRVKRLDPLAQDQYLIGETPFVFGSYKITAPVFIPDGAKRDERFHKFEKPVILGDGRYRNWLSSDPNCVALVDFYHGSALAHDISLIPEFGSKRQRYAFMGLPQLKGEFPWVKKAEKFNFPQPRGDQDREILFSPFEVTIESDGRRGRMYTARENEVYFKKK